MLEYKRYDDVMIVFYCPICLESVSVQETAMNIDGLMQKAFACMKCGHAAEEVPKKYIHERAAKDRPVD